ncbi:MAG: divalent-cation tolerance protein CutA [Candidatus Omnitrophica bacterium]|nr:divalent-cation tolerance protein CutA [Candidatus Omnitrophota bacterium]
MYIVIFITAKDEREAKKITNRLIDKGLIACGNIIPAITSIFFWQGKVDEESEALLILKTKKERFASIVKEVKKMHSYDVPEIIAIPIIDGNEDYLKWVDESVQ